MFAYIYANALNVDKNWGQLSLPGLMSFGSMYLPNTDERAI